MYMQKGGAALNSILIFNRAPSGPNYAGSSEHTIEWCATIPPVTAPGNITNDPQFVSAATGDYRLQAASPVIDAGTNSPAPAPDRDGVRRPLDGDNNGSAVVDMGAYERVHPDADSEGDGMPDGWELGKGLDPTVDDSGGDSDLDGSDNGDEYIAGTDPNDCDDRLWISYADAETVPGDFVIQWPTVSGRYYTVYLSTNLLEAWTNRFELVGDGLPAVYTNALDHAAFLTIGVSSTP
jgi:hypothetical protein